MGAGSGNRILDRRAHRHQRATGVTGGIDSRPRGRCQSRAGTSDHGRQYSACRRPRFAPVSTGKFAGLDNSRRVGNHRRAVRHAGCRGAYFSQTLNSSSDVPLWDRLFAPLLAAAAGALTTGIFFHPNFTLPIPHYPHLRIVDIISGAIVTLIAIAVGMVAVWCLPRLHALIHRLKNPVLMLGIGGFLLGIPGVIGGHITLFKGLDEMQQLASSQTLGAGDFLLIAVVKLAALVLASACGFRGGRIFPAVFVGVSLGLMLHAHVEAVPAAITISCAILGLVLVVTRDGWLSLFMASVVVPDTTLLPLLCIVMLPAWLLLAGKPLMIAKRRDD